MKSWSTAIKLCVEVWQDFRMLSKMRGVGGCKLANYSVAASTPPSQPNPDSPPPPTAQVLSMPCLVHGNFHGELVFKTIGPLAVAAVIGSVQVMLRSNFITTSRPWRHQSMRCTEYLLALAYFVLTPATNAALRTFSCEV